MTGNHPSRLTEVDRSIIARARRLAAVPPDSDANREYAGEADADHARALMLGEAKHLLGELASIAERLGGTAGLSEGDPNVELDDTRDTPSRTPLGEQSW